MFNYKAKHIFRVALTCEITLLAFLFSATHSYITLAWVSHYKRETILNERNKLNRYNNQVKKNT